MNTTEVTNNSEEFDFLKEAISGNDHNVNTKLDTVLEEAVIEFDINGDQVMPDKQYHVLEDGRKSEIINGRYNNGRGNWVFAPGNKAGEVNRGVLKPRTINFKEKMRVKDWEKLTAYIEGNGIEKFVEEMEKLEERDYITAYLGILPYVKPKIANVEVEKDKGKKKEKTGHTITIRDMRDGSEQKISK